MNPILVEVLRNQSIESVHRGAVVALNARGETLLSVGDTDALVFPRSSLKPLQVLPLVESGAIDQYAITDQELALACASHSGQPVHMQVLSNWMQRVGLTPAQLECGPSLPLHKESAHAHLRSGGEASRELHNCSGKHTGMLTMSAFLEESLAGYSDYDHVSQRQWMEVLSELSGVNIFDMPWDRDGCGLPAVAMPLISFARAFVLFCTQNRDNSKRAKAAARVAAAMRAHPQLVAGSDRCCTGVMQEVDNLLVKTGAEGVFISVAARAGVVIALKTDDGATRGAEAILGATLRHLGLISAKQYELLSAWFCPPIHNSQQVVIGSIKPAGYWSDL